MQLSKLEIRGFKSFGDKVMIHFDKGITGIVGPNGCGKSNVVDAIRWVLGEQKTRMLRSDKMENVIFNGTKNRKQLNMAEVSLTFENTKNLLPTEYTHVTITRRYYRSGESEYLLNGITCRLKDITNLFMDTGINSNSYAIIELKMIDELLNDKNNSRRDLFEEAAGISKFKTRKKETLKKLGDTDADLDRVEDLLFEIEKNLKSLEKQARQATRYFEIKKGYKSASIALAKKGVIHQRDVLINLNQKLEQENDQKVQLNAELANKDAFLENLKAEMIHKEKLLGSRQKTLNEHVHKIRQFESDKKIKNERLRFLQDKSHQLREQIEQDKKSNERAGFSIKSLEQEHRISEKLTQEKEHSVEELKAVYEEKKAQHNVSLEKQKVMQSTYSRKRDELYQLSKSQEIKQIQLTTIKQELEKTATDDNSQIENLAGFEEKLQLIKGQLDEENAAFEKLKKEEAAHLAKQEETSRMQELIREELTQINRKLDAKSNEYQLTKSLVDNLEGFPEAIKFLRKNSQWGKNMPLLSDIITTDEKYRVTIENFLENYMNYYVVDNDAEAIAAVKLLSDSGKGKAHFFVLERFEKFRPSQNKLFPDAVAATEIIEYDSKYAPLVAYLLDDVYIFSGDIHQVPRSQEGIFITESGKFIDREFTISGGSVGLFEGKRIGRAKNLEKLDKEIKVLQKKINETRANLDKKTAELSKLKAVNFKQTLEEKQLKVNELNQDFVSIKTKKEQLAEMLSSNANKKEDIEDKIFTLTEELENIGPKLKEEKEDFDLLEEEINNINAELQEDAEELSHRSSQYNEENILYHQLLNKLQSIEQEISFKKSTYESSKERIEKAQADMGQTEQEIMTLIDNNEVKDDELIELYEEKDSIETGVNDAEKDYYAARGEIDEVEKAIREIQRKKEQSDALLMDLKQTTNEINLKLSGIKERLSVEFELDLDEIMAENHDLDDEHASKSEEVLREEVQKAKSKLEKMGPINPMAMEAYDEIKERHTFITAQKEDLIQAKDSLMSTIKEIDQVAKETFIDAFEKIKINFVKVFRSLFTEEDDCDLKLTNPEMPLESTIEIIAKPKGKRPLTINQLSGGEKTLTATSLLFSIYLLKPAPFCIFDEVDAPLDDANIDKFNQIIQKFSNESQFIIVTHNKRTMASTDIIYGITMIEAGVSRVVPVDLRELVDEEASQR
ncbi:chromosome segregation protein SMC [Cyclobacterium sp. 1_MG-2023]|uniref:chromosome segregation protein SMC n=1 Tax=Cyclobacterium sp. 1_MG-2023 TaxID=3062681 RepID=UPI0026E3562B|nr:chromosome segregation protein SMC [Cyclobacterium sp. 1_MG-2023]MDO6437235.1 chromosome segregation protein SMC [Cyclobacterium sp. 1_MG-2023]